MSDYDMLSDDESAELYWLMVLVYQYHQIIGFPPTLADEITRFMADFTHYLFDEFKLDDIQNLEADFTLIEPGADAGADAFTGFIDTLDMDDL